ncbi:RNase H family protein (plasmid) [Acidithiobacillus ferriphilus]|uniref:RNase H family protein n=1 Tax=Acidithiobacillus TaxID=119977 RepID=UPI0034E5CF29
MSSWKIWCDGACAPTNPGPCAWGAVIQSPDGDRTEHFGFIQALGTNNIAELTAAIESLRKIPVGEAVVLCSDNYVHAGSAKVVHAYKQASGEEMSKGFGFIKRMLKGGG